MAATLPRRLFLVRGPASGNAVCLTFDDGPHPEHTPRVLDVLKQARVPATFFLIGERAERHPDLVRRIAAEGHVLGHHTFTHGDPSRTSARQVREEVRRTGEVLVSLTGREPTLFRPPLGKVTAAKLFGLWRDGQTVVLWSVDPKDSARRSEEEVRDWFDRHPLQGGDIVLLHDDRPHAAAILPGLIERTRKRGLTFATPPDWLHRRAPRPGR
jgi:peptidoglycan/xylan/chitin deacetylase (PgdA/CDA1 family)